LRWRRTLGNDDDNNNNDCCTNGKTTTTNDNNNNGNSSDGWIDLVVLLLSNLFSTRNNQILAGWVAALVSYFIISIFDFSLSRLCVGTNLSPSFL
jgi:hypothetical protein